MAATAAALLRNAWSHQHIHASSDLSDLSSQRVNIVHIRRPGLLPQLPPAQHLMHRPAVKVVINAAKPDAAVAHLLQAVQQPSLQQQLQQDLQLAVQHICAVMERDHVRAKLEIIQRQSCPQFHADTVGVRLLCSYAGPGTWYLENRHVHRDFSVWKGEAGIRSVDEQHAVQVTPGDLLFLKGHSSPGMRGAGGVHKSPEIAGEEDYRLLLTVDDACCV